MKYNFKTPTLLKKKPNNNPVLNKRAFIFWHLSNISRVSHACIVTIYFIYLV